MFIGKKFLVFKKESSGNVFTGQPYHLGSRLMPIKYMVCLKMQR